MTVAKYQTRFLTLERFAPSSYREQATQFVSRLRIHIKSIVDTFACKTLLEAVMRALECEHAQESHHQIEDGGLST